VRVGQLGDRLCVLFVAIRLCISDPLKESAEARRTEGGSRMKRTIHEEKCHGDYNITALVRDVPATRIKSY
jgi:hypothetical protein